MDKSYPPRYESLKDIIQEETKRTTLQQAGKVLSSKFFWVFLITLIVIGIVFGVPSIREDVLSCFKSSDEGANCAGGCFKSC